MTLSLLVDSFLDHARVERGLSKNSVESYARDLKGFCEFLESEGIDDVEAIDLAVVSQWLMSLTARGLSP